MHHRGPVWEDDGRDSMIWNASSLEAVHNPGEGLCYRPIVNNTAGAGRQMIRDGFKCDRFKASQKRRRHLHQRD